jgi:hypothetical protein
MTYYIFQTVLLLLGAFIVGAVFGCILRGIIGDDGSEYEAPASAVDATGAEIAPDGTRR